MNKEQTLLRSQVKLVWEAFPDAFCLPRTHWNDFIEDIGRNRLGLDPASEMIEVVADHDMWRLNPELLHPLLLSCCGP